MPFGAPNCPCPDPLLPMTSRNVPVGENFSIRPLFVSATRKFPLRSTAIPVGESNSPLPVPLPPSNMLLTASGNALEVGRWCIGHLVNDQAVILVGVVHLWKISGIQLLVRSFNELRLPNSVVVSDVLNAILFQKMDTLSKDPCSQTSLCINPVAVARVVTG